MADVDMGKNSADFINDMDNSDENEMETDQEIAEAKKNEGNELYKQQQYGQAIECYSEAIRTCPLCAAYYNNRAAAYMMLDKYRQALDDVHEALRLNNKLVKSHLREAKCHIAMGNADAGIRSLERIADIEPLNKQAEFEMRTAKLVQLHDQAAEKAFGDGDFRKVVYDMDRAIIRAPASSRFKIRRAEALAKLKRFGEAQEALNGLLMREPMNADALYVRGLCLYYQDSIEKAQQHFQQVLRLAPDHKLAITAFKRCKLLKNKKDQGNDAFKKGQYQGAYDLYTEALSIDPHNVNTNAKLYCNRATVGSKLRKLDQSIQDCTSAIELDENYLKAYMRRAKCYYDTEQFEEAVRDYDKVFNMDKTRENKRVLQDAKLELKKSKRKDYYKVLSVAKAASEDEIKKAYRKHALLHHPDRHASKSEKERKDEEIKFKEVNEAYSILSDTKKRHRYDSGQDLEEMEGFSGFDPNQIFQTFFGAPGGFHFGHGGGGGGHGFPGHGHGHGGGGYQNGGGGGGGFPGGFQFQFG